MRALMMTVPLATAALVVLVLSIPCDDLPPPEAHALEAPSDPPPHVVDTGLDRAPAPKYDPVLEPQASALLKVYVDDRAELTCPGSLLRQRFDQNTRAVLDESDLPTTCVVRVGDEAHWFQVYSSGTVQCVTTSGELVCDRNRVGP